MAFDLSNLLTPSKCDPNLRNFSKGGPATVTGRAQRVFFDAGFWEIAYEILLNTPAKVRAWRSAVARMRSGEQVNAPIFERSQVPGALSSEAVATLQGSVLLRATQITIRATGVKIEAGMFFGIADRFHEVTSVVSGSGNGYFNPLTGDGPWRDDMTWSDGAPPAVDYVVKVLPPMRAAYAGGTTIKLRDIVMLGELADLGQGDTSLDLIRHGSVGFTIRESI